MLYRILKPWRFSRHGSTVETAEPGGTLGGISQGLAADGIAGGFIEIIAGPDETQAATRAPEAKARRGRKPKGRGR